MISFFKIMRILFGLVSTVSYIKKEGSKFVVYSHSGKKFGEYDTREKAEKRLQQMEYFKNKGEKK